MSGRGIGVVLMLLVATSAGGMLLRETLPPAPPPVAVPHFDEVPAAPAVRLLCTLPEPPASPTPDRE